MQLVRGFEGACRRDFRICMWAGEEEVLSVRWTMLRVDFRRHSPWMHCAGLLAGLQLAWLPRKGRRQKIQWIPVAVHRTRIEPSNRSNGCREG